MKRTALALAFTAASSLAQAATVSTVFSGGPAPGTVGPTFSGVLTYDYSGGAFSNVAVTTAGWTLNDATAPGTPAPKAWAQTAADGVDELRVQLWNVWDKIAFGIFARGDLLEDGRFMLTGASSAHMNRGDFTGGTTAIYAGTLSGWTPTASSVIGLPPGGMPGAPVLEAPEPSTYALLGIGLLSFIVLGVRKRGGRS